MVNSCLKQVHRNLPRLLASYDTDESSSTYGVGDRFYWSWKLIDFPNATFQGAVSGLAGLCAAELLPEHISESCVLKRIDSMVKALPNLMSANGGLSEAIPNEGSFCVTGLVAADVLLAVERLRGKVPEEALSEYLQIVKPLIGFLHGQDEFHGIISNHLATCSLALVLWSELTGEDSDLRAKVFVDRILENQSSEGWFREYEGADAGYQTWCTSSLAAVHLRRPSWGLGKALDRSLHFLSYAAHPDGSFGGSYGSRMTRFIFPAGLVLLQSEFGIARELMQFAFGSIENSACVTLDAIDASNMIPLFDDYVTAAMLYTSELVPSSANPSMLQNRPKTKYFSDSGWFFSRTDDYHTILNLKKGGCGLHFSGSNRVEVTAFLGVDERQRTVSSQFFDEETVVRFEDERTIEITNNIRVVKRPLPTPLRFIVLRILSLSVFRSVKLGNVVKVFLAKYLVNRKDTSVGKCTRTLRLASNCMHEDKVTEGIRPIEVNGFRPIHMASQGYWQAADDRQIENDP